MSGVGSRSELERAFCKAKPRATAAGAAVAYDCRIVAGAGSSVARQLCGTRWRRRQHSCGWDVQEKGADERRDDKPEQRQPIQTPGEASSHIFHHPNAPGDEEAAEIAYRIDPRDAGSGSRASELYVRHAIYHARRTDRDRARPPGHGRCRGIGRGAGCSQPAGGSICSDGSWRPDLLGSRFPNSQHSSHCSAGGIHEHLSLLTGSERYAMTTFCLNVSHTGWARFRSVSPRPNHLTRRRSSMTLE